MNHNPSDSSANVPPSGQAVVDRLDRLDPSLQKALNCLDIKLEDELTRFRSKQEDPAPERKAEQTAETIWEQESPDFDADAEIFTAEIVHPVKLETERAKSLTERGEPEPTGGFIIIDGLSTSSTNSRNTLTTVNYAPILVDRQDRSAVDENLDLNFSTGGEMAAFHGEYLSSSQELLRQIQSDYPAGSEAFRDDSRTTSATPAPKRKHLTPLKIGSMAAACVLAGGASYAYFNPSILTIPLVATKTITPTATTNLLGQSIQSPNLAANEFTELNLSTLNTIKLPTTAVATNVISAAPTATMNGTATATTPVAIPFNTVNAKIVPPTAIITSQPRLADSLIKSLLPPNFQTFAKPSGYRSIPPALRR
ncbi:hypothetical protein [Chamaesiphon sp. VAR_48_metabat_135_sub]|uniref:hypothetical protein n=1 Tax=Chamaesiphon sp. VAR_48_metabat_135_sub TaxID=2964699 RepID=UPI00286C9D62|nr:hypothetical protein [Chamaesiphon sp. VAR_48_metabat_135_sub]